MVAVVLAGTAIGSSLTPTPVMDPGPSTPGPYPTCVFRLDEEDGLRNAGPCVYTSPYRHSGYVLTATALVLATWVATAAPGFTAEAIWQGTEIAEIKAEQTPTPCPEPPTPVVPWVDSEFARCWSGYRAATRTAGLLDGSFYVITNQDGPYGTPTVVILGTVPAYADRRMTAQAAEDDRMATRRARR
jgi:hypothetical protein